MRPEPGADRRCVDLENRLYGQAARLARLGAWECTIATERLFWTEGVYDVFDIPIGSRLKRSSIVGLYFDESRQQMEFMRAEAIATGQSFALDAQIRTGRGENRWIRISVDVAYEGTQAVRIFGGKQDITRDMEGLARLKQCAERDALTGLANRGQFDARTRAIAQDSLNHGFVSVLAMIDIDQFKQINDTFGHPAGDECLRQTARRLQHVFDQAVLIARIGGDEFAVFLPAPLTRSRIAATLRRASSLLCKPVLWNTTRIDMSASIGAAILAPLRGRTRSDCFADADAALYAAKSAGRNAVHIFGDGALATAAAVPPGRLP